MSGTDGPRRVDVATVGICALAFLILLSYEIARSSVESMFLADFGAEALPWAWLAVAGGVIAAVGVYDRFCGRVPLLHLFLGALGATAGALVLLAGARSLGVRHGTFLLYVWKDVHIVLLLEILWTLASLTFDLKRARWLYGVICAMGSLGGLTGGLVVGAAASAWSTMAALWLVLPSFALVALVAAALGRRVDPEAPVGEARRRPGFAEAFGVLRRSRYLVLMVALVSLVQIVVNLVDYEYNAVLEATFADTDARTAVMGRVYAAINVAAIALQLLTGPILRLLGVPATLMAIPAILFVAVGGFAALRQFAVMAATKVASKAFDYSLFKAAKEILYLPLGYAEKTRGKAVVDMLTYRLAKGAASALLVLLVWLDAGALVLWLALALVVAWAAVTVAIVRRYRQDVDASQGADSVEKVQDSAGNGR